MELGTLLTSIDALNVKSRGSTAWIRACKSSKLAFRAMDELKRFNSEVSPLIQNNAEPDPVAMTTHANRLLKYADASSLQCRCMKSILATGGLDAGRAIATFRALAGNTFSKRTSCL